MAGSYDAAARFREEARLWDNPPPCGKLIRYRPHKIVASGGDGEFIFNSSDFEEAILETLHDHPHLAKDQLSSVLKWLRQRDESITEPTPVPDGWWKLHDIADDVPVKFVETEDHMPPKAGGDDHNADQIADEKVIDEFHAGLSEVLLNGQTPPQSTLSSPPTKPIVCLP